MGSITTTERGRAERAPRPQQGPLPVPAAGLQLPGCPIPPPGLLGAAASSVRFASRPSLGTAAVCSRGCARKSTRGWFERPACPTGLTVASRQPPLLLSPASPFRHCSSAANRKWLFVDHVIRKWRGDWSAAGCLGDRKKGAKRGLWGRSERSAEVGRTEGSEIRSLPRTGRRGGTRRALRGELPSSRWVLETSRNPLPGDEGLLPLATVAFLEGGSVAATGQGSPALADTPLPRWAPHLVSRCFLTWST